MRWAVVLREHEGGRATRPWPRGLLRPLLVRTSRANCAPARPPSP